MSSHGEKLYEDKNTPKKCFYFKYSFAAAGIVSSIFLSFKKGNLFRIPSSTLRPTATILTGSGGVFNFHGDTKKDQKEKLHHMPQLENYRNQDFIPPSVLNSNSLGIDPSSKNCKKHKKIVQDCIHGAVELKPIICKIIDTKYFQRQRNLFQLGLTCFVFPTASHTRFEHAIGTYHLASKFLAHLLLEQNDLLRNELKITDNDVLCVEIAALCHDIGHGPFSHFWDIKFIPRQAKEKGFEKLKHEEWSARILHFLFEELEETAEFKSCGLSPPYIRFIKCLILGSGSVDKYLTKEDKELIFPDGVEKKKFLFEIVSNSETKVDVDKWDYLARDSMYLGCGNIFPGFIIQRYMLMHRVKNCQGVYKLALRNSETFSIMAMFQMRQHLHRIAYQHRAKEQIEEMLYDALAAADVVYKFSEISKRPDGKEEIPRENVEKYLSLSDYLFWSIIYSEDERLSQSKVILQRILERDLYNVVHVFHPKKEQIENGIVKSCEAVLDANKFSISMAAFNYGNGCQNPLKDIYFFDELNNTVVQGEWKISDMLIPKIFEEFELRLIDKRSKEERRKNPTEAKEVIKQIASLIHEF